MDEKASATPHAAPPLQGGLVDREDTIHTANSAEDGYGGEHKHGKESEMDGEKDKVSSGHTAYATKEAEAYPSPTGSEDAGMARKEAQRDQNVNINARIANPLEGLSRQEVFTGAADFCSRNGMEEYTSTMQKGALVAQNGLDFEALSELDEEDKRVLREEVSHKWRHPGKLYAMTILCSMAAATQGWDETAINGALLIFPEQFGIGSDSDRDSWLQGLLGSAPYIGCAFLGCWLTIPLNHYFGRRGSIFFAATLSALTCVWQGLTSSWQHMFVARLMLGLGIGPKSATVPVFAAECAPPLIRGALVMQWQTWTAFGIMMGYIADIALYYVPDTSAVTGLNWRLMLGAASLPAWIVMAQVWFVPESPRWLMKKGRYREALQSFIVYRNTELQACRDLYLAYVMLEEEKKWQTKKGLALWAELWTVPRNLRATIAATICMFGQQFCGVNVIAYYSSSILKQANFSNIQALLGSFGFGSINFLFAIPAWFTIDTFGRRSLLLLTTPLMALFLVVTGCGFYAPAASSAQVGVVLTGIYLFAAVYSPGFGPVPFTYSAEASPLYIREIAMAQATAVLWFFNAVLAITYFRLSKAFTPAGSFFYYAAWNIVLFCLVFLLLPETKSLSLEELDMVFGVPTHKHIAYQFRNATYNLRKNVLRQKGLEKEHLYEVDPDMKRTAAPMGAAA